MNTRSGSRPVAAILPYSVIVFCRRCWLINPGNRARESWSANCLDTRIGAMVRVMAASVTDSIPISISMFMISPWAGAVCQGTIGLTRWRQTMDSRRRCRPVCSHYTSQLDVGGESHRRWVAGVRRKLRTSGAEP